MNAATISNAMMGPPAPAMPQILEMVIYFAAAVFVSVMGALVIVRRE